MTPRLAGAGVAVAACAALVLGGCGGGSTVAGDRAPAAGPTIGPTASGVASDRSPQSRGPRVQVSARPDPLEDLPDRPPPGDARGLAEDLALAERALRDPAMDESVVRRAAEFTQLAARMLARGPEVYAEQVLALLEPVVASRTRAHVEAATLLDAMSDPQPELPDWRIVEPLSPGELLGHYRLAEERIGVPWEYLAAVHLVETRMGRIRGVSTAGAQGPMQFLPTTWDIYGEGGDIQDPRDAILAAARLLDANGAPEDMSEALWHYNPSDNYVGAVRRYAEQMTAQSYRGYWHWRVLYKHVDGTYLLDVGYPQQPAELID